MTQNRLPTSSKYGVIYADPPWNWRARSVNGEGRSAKRHYDVMTLDDIKQLPVAECAADNCALFLWATDPMLPQALEVMNAWGFEYKTVGFYWAKLLGAKGFGRRIREDDWTIESIFHTGMGYWTRANPELCLLGTVGTPTRKSKAVRRLVVDHVGRHSQKPEQVHKRIEQLVPGPYLELFARAPYPGWDVWGNEV